MSPLRIIPIENIYNNILLTFYIVRSFEFKRNIYWSNNFVIIIINKKNKSYKQIEYDVKMGILKVLYETTFIDPYKYIKCIPLNDGDKYVTIV